MANETLNEQLAGFITHIGKDIKSLTDDDKKKAFAPYKFEIESIKDKTFNDNLYEDVRSYYNKK